MKLIDILQDQKEALQQAESVLAKAGGRELTASETTAYEGAMARYKHLTAQAEDRQAQSTLRQIVGDKFPALMLGSGARARNGQTLCPPATPMPFLPSSVRAASKQAPR